MTSPLQIYTAYQQRLRARDYEHLNEVADVKGYTENCLGLTGWTTGLEVALQNYARNILAAFSDVVYETEDAIESADALAIRSRAEGIHTGTFLGVPATGRRIAWDIVALVHTRDGRVIGQWIQPDLWSIYQQLTSAVAGIPQTLSANPPLGWPRSAN